MTSLFKTDEFSIKQTMMDFALKDDGLWSRPASGGVVYTRDEYGVTECQLNIN